MASGKKEKGDNKKEGLMVRLKDYFNAWAEDPKKMALEDGRKVGAGVVGGAVVGSFLAFLPLVSSFTAAVAVGALCSKPLTPERRQLVDKTKQAGRQLGYKAVQKADKLLPPPEEKSKKGPFGKGPGRKP